MSATVLDGIVDRLAEALAYNENAFVEPVALLWPDESEQWKPILDRVSVRLPLLRLGSHEPASRQGPAYWIRCVVAGTVDAALPAGAPIVYLSGVARSEVRAIDSCPATLAPIAELQYRSQWFSHPNSRDWTVRAFLSNEDKGLGLQVADDAETNAIMLSALGYMLDLRLDRLSKQVLDADFFRNLINPDPVRSLLDWLDDPSGFRPRLDDAQWAAFVQQCQADYGFDPATEGALTAACLLGQRDGAWAEVWNRFAEIPERYPGIPERLRQAKPLDLLTVDQNAWPQDNEAGEAQLRGLLLDFAALTPEGARAEAARVEAEHASRRRTVWASLGLAPLAFVAEQLAALAELTAAPLSGDLEGLIQSYSESAWRADDAVMRALASASSPQDRAATSVAVRAIYLPWLDAAARALQAAIGPLANANTYQATPPAATAKGTITVFVDGLRMDVAHRLRERLVAGGLNADLQSALAALPTVTPTAKPAVVPVAAGALGAGPDLHAANASTGTKASIQVLRALMAAQDIDVLAPTELGDPSRVGWTEVGEIDHRGHDLGVRLVDYLDEELERVVVRIRELMEGDWQRVEIVTDHGWMLLPGGMEKVELQVAATEAKKGRCARLKEGANVSVPTVPWYWDQDVRIAVAPGATCFEANKEYEHGGISPQECIVPRISVTAGTSALTMGGPEITKVKWLGLLCRIEFTGVGQGVVADLRALPADAKTSIAEEAKETSSSGKLSLVVPDEEHEGERAHLVLVDRDGQMLAQREVVVGRNR